MASNDNKTADNDHKTANILPTQRTLDDYLASVKTSCNEITIDASWGQGRTIFGGMSAALLLKKINLDAPDTGLLRSINIAFCGPLLSDQPGALSSREIRSGKSTAHWQAELVQNEKVATMITACFGHQRDSDIEVKHPAMEQRLPEAGKPLPYIKGLTPEFVQHIDFIYHDGQLPFSNSKVNHIHGLMRFRDQSGPLQDEHLIALIDSWPPTVLQKMKRMAPCASVTWNLEIVTPLSQLPRPIAADEYLNYEADIRQAHDGYAHTEARIATQDGVLLALSRQLVAVYDKK
ncbi:acyl-CoA thioesterase [Bacterioplanoides sp.]|uniref:acyl-CoA thioesterase n=1 Tax=Bacterioplanoides sp. TaxID=2066072 RepID=UPI003B002E13